MTMMAEMRLSGVKKNTARVEDRFSRNNASNPPWMLHARDPQ
jgi:hypothetical protein